VDPQKKKRSRNRQLINLQLMLPSLCRCKDFKESGHDRLFTEHRFFNVFPLFVVIF
jgi:hypothetical protein